MENIYFISVVRDFELYNKCITKNNFVINNSKIKCIAFDNREENIAIPKRYNQFINEFDFSNESWLIFCHSDWEIKEDIEKILVKLDKEKIYGPIGAYGEFFKDKYFSNPHGFCRELTRDEKKTKTCGDLNEQGDLTVDTLDCQAIFIHSNLIKKYNLKFDENLSWDLYVEDFCINAKQNFNVVTRAVLIDCVHHSDAGFKEVPPSYKIAKEYIDKKYPNICVSGCCSTLGGLNYPTPTPKETIFYNLRNRMKKNKV